MDRLVGKVALVTGASAGTGAAITVQLANNGMKVIGIARRQEKIEALKKDVTGPGEIFALKADVTKDEDIDEVFNYIKTKFGALHVLINNAGIFRPGLLADQDHKFIREAIAVNIVGVSLCTQKALKLMKDTQIDGQIIHINCVDGHNVPNVPDPAFSIYPATKHAVTAMTETLRQELNFLKSKIRISSISPGFIESEIGEAGLEAVGSDPEIWKKLVDGWPALQPKDVADCVVFVLSTPPHVQIHDIIVKPLGEPY